MEVVYCRKCHEKKRDANFDRVVKKIQELDNVTRVSDRCISYCAPGSSKYFSLVDDELISGEDLEDLIKKIEEY